MAAAPPRPRASYFVCASPRTGSTLLCDGLGRTGVVGRPIERFDDRPQVDARYKAALGAADDVDYLDRAIAAATTANGIAGFKIHWHQLPVFERMVVASHAAAGAGAGDREDYRLALLGPARCLWLRRRDKVAQAVSLYRASRSRVWHRRVAAPAGTPDAEARIAYDFAEIDRLRRLCLRYERQWDGYLRRHRVPALTIWYEILSERYEEVMRVVLDFLGFPEARVVAPALAKLSNAESLAWIERYREDARARRVSTDADALA
ncbi:Stf0 family sulfotransferase [Sphingomonas morindae]|uniref:Stf0 sulfotransferase family protein n=1 Tax=Sphingomonas morindae TaxID=1541170 RepID=A0ABY4X7D8_9SPHN|nr:Stf0 family sulfotransferase [Sphingomonas morindae]USI72791.1 Stf0 sulfotransferase family protein [Sphingomonas morindae]